MAEEKNPMVEVINNLRHDLPPAAMFEQLAEECVELAKCALKQARIMRNENPTPLDLVDVVKATDEEVTDVFVCFEVMGLRPNEQLMGAKIARWGSRVSASKAMQGFDIPQEAEEEVTPAEVIE